MVNHIAGIYYKRVDSHLYDVWLAYEGGVVMVCYEVECSDLDRLGARVEGQPFRTSNRPRCWLEEHCEFWGATSTQNQPRI